MGYVYGTSACFGCRRIFSYNPHRVPSIPIEGDRKPICQDCVEQANPERIKRGLEPIVPLPGAYDPIDEYEL
jgi:hypothetical protein